MLTPADVEIKLDPERIIGREIHNLRESRAALQSLLVRREETIAAMIFASRRLEKLDEQIVIARHMVADDRRKFDVRARRFRDLMTIVRRLETYKTTDALVELVEQATAIVAELDILTDAEREMEELCFPKKM